jgi:NAD(P)-dependent dehydrogenase (short-subunit alcohol dehydrogenase family)
MKSHAVRYSLVVRLANKVAIVTGSGTGIGRAIALRFGAEGTAPATRRAGSRAWRCRSTAA